MLAPPLDLLALLSLLAVFPFSALFPSFSHPKTLKPRKHRQLLPRTLNLVNQQLQEKSGSRLKKSTASSLLIPLRVPPTLGKPLLFPPPPLSRLSRAINATFTTTSTSTSRIPRFID